MQQNELRIYEKVLGESCVASDSLTMGSKAYCKPYCKAVVLATIFVAVTARTTEVCGGSLSRRFPTAVPSLTRLQQVGIRGGDVKPPRDLFANAVDVGEEKAKADVSHVLMLSIMSGTGKKVLLPP